MDTVVQLVCDIAEYMAACVDAWSVQQPAMGHNKRLISIENLHKSLMNI